MTATMTPPEAPPTAEHPTADRQSGDVQPPTDQQRFDAEVDRNGGFFLRVLGAVGIMVAIGISTIALVVASQNHGSAMVMPSAPVAAVPTAPVSQAIKLSVAGSIKKGPDGKMHDAFSKTDFAVKVGQPTHMVINNKDSGPHSITAAGTGVSITVLPGTHTYTMVATKAGRFEWMCVIPCDSAAKGWAMNHPGYMAGYITAT